MTSDVLEEWTVAECAAHWNIEPSTWRSCVARNQAPKPKRHVGRTPVWDPEEVRGWPRPGQGARTDLKEASVPHWHYAMLELVPEDALVRPMISPESEGLTREQAHREIQGLLDRLGSQDPGFRELAATWRRGAKDDWVYRGPFSFTIFECAGSTCAETFQTFLDDYAATMRQAGVQVAVAQISRPAAG
jgi:hypothetical protein